MFLDYFTRARNYLSEHGLKPCVELGERVSEIELVALDLSTDMPMPAELRQFYLELGDGFRFIPDAARESNLTGWEAMHLDDHKIANIGFAGQIEEDALAEINKPAPRSDPQLLRQEMEKRKRWMPFYGFVGGGDYLCLDLTLSPPAVRFHDSLCWVAIPQTWDFILATSLTDFVERWHRYHFLSPSGAWTSYCRGRSGRFDWAPEHFPKIVAQS
jgi:hypothetical protein